jgi:hypothetical protein
VPAHADPGVQGRSLIGDNSGGEQDPQVPAHRRPGRPRSRGDLARPARPLAQELYHGAPGRIGQRIEDRRDIISHS